ncbi:MAG: YeeE/YedE family protein [Candidatus Marinimicrobia bacterium]|nr:YeeE/YedE family protein [Candidatus Neomarinimicrobiota bacterium]MBL7047366.1 YeeE/YedE family protein [Candidatus Neomarinimicrobiota bacterium]
MAPFYKFGFFSDNFSLLIAFMIGIAFGFFLERGGLGNSRKLAAQFYLTDLTVFKVMFTAIVTATLGLFWLSWLGILDLSLVYLNPTYIIPQLAGGFIFGFGFVISGLCPGTSCVALATGKLDGLFTLIGIFAGIFIFSELFPLLSEFFYSTSMGPVTVAQFFHTSQGIIILVVILLASAGFIGAEILENNTTWTVIKKQFQSLKPFTMNKTLVLTAILFALFAALTSKSYYHLASIQNSIEEQVFEGYKIQKLGVHKLANWIMEKKKDYTILDIRSIKDYEKYHIPFSRNLNQTSLPDLKDNLTKKIVIYDDSDNIPLGILSWLGENGVYEIYILKGGIMSWRRAVLFPDLAYTGLNESEIKIVKKMSYYFGGEPLLRGSAANPSTLKFQREGC